MEQTNMDKSGQESAKGTPSEGKFTRQVEKYTGNVPSTAYLSLALGSMAVSAAIALVSRKKTVANFIGLWVPTLMLVGVYNKLVKMESSWAARLH